MHGTGRGGPRRVRDRLWPYFFISGMFPALYMQSPGRKRERCPSADINLSGLEGIISQDNVERLLGRLVTDADFRREAAISLEKLCYREGYELTAGELRLLARIDVHALERMALLLDLGLLRAGRASGRK